MEISFSKRRFELAALLKAHGLGPLESGPMDLLRRILDGGELGASRHAELSQQLLADLAAGPPAEATNRVRLTADFIASTRGAETPLVANAIAWLLAEGVFAPEALRRRAVDWRGMTSEARRRLVEHAAEHLGRPKRLVLFDYSGTVVDIIRELAARGAAPELSIPESRCIAGGRRYVEALVPLGLPIQFLFDAALDHTLVGADALLLGAESLRRDGSLVNTLGSRAAARIARALVVPVYGCAELVKLDARPGHQIADPEARAFDAILMRDWSPAGASVDTRQPELEVVPPDLLSGVFTERGVLSAAELASQDPTTAVPACATS